MSSYEFNWKQETRRLARFSNASLDSLFEQEYRLFSSHLQEYMSTSPPEKKTQRWHTNRFWHKATISLRHVFKRLSKIEGLSLL